MNGITSELLRRMGSGDSIRISQTTGSFISRSLGSVLKRAQLRLTSFLRSGKYSERSSTYSTTLLAVPCPRLALRASIWQSVLTCDMRRYRRTMWKRMADFPTLVTGPSGSGKELVARAIGGARYIPFDPIRLTFDSDQQSAFLAINVAALSPTLIESELFGHRRGSFTGAIADRKGWLETCPALGSVFLDELGEMDLSLQVKLLRVHRDAKVLGRGRHDSA